MEDKKRKMLALFKTYADRFGEVKMSEGIMRAWWEILNVREIEHVEEAFSQLIASQKFAFTAKQVLDVCESMYPKNVNLATVKAYKDQPKVEESDHAKRAKLTKIQAELVRKKKDKTRVGFDFEDEYASAFVDVWGRKQAIKISGRMYVDNEIVSSRFLELVNEKLRT